MWIYKNITYYLKFKLSSKISIILLTKSYIGWSSSTFKSDSSEDKLYNSSLLYSIISSNPLKSKLLSKISKIFVS